MTDHDMDMLRRKLRPALNRTRAMTTIRFERDGVVQYRSFYGDDHDESDKRADAYCDENQIAFSEGTHGRG